MGLFGGKSREASLFEWNLLTSDKEFDDYMNQSEITPVLFFKHSTRCSISAMAKSRLESKWNFSIQEIIPVYLDLIKYREVSNNMADSLRVQHESPQAILIRNKMNIYTASHSAISVDAIKKVL